MNKEVNAVVVLGGGLKKDNNIWRTTNFNEGDNFGGLGDRLRVVAAYYLYKRNPDIVIIALGGSGQLQEIKGSPAVSEIIKNELVALGVPKEKIITETKSGNTLEQLLAIQKMIYTTPYERILLLSNEFHLPRVKAMIEYLEKLSALFKMFSDGTLNLLSAEKICIDNDKIKWDPVIQNAYRSELMQKRISLEAKGVEDIKKGEYK